MLITSSIFALTAFTGPHLTTEPTGPRVIITEIMYDPASDERRGESEWVEIANVGDEPIDIKDWKLDDEDTQEWAQWGPFSCTLLPGQVAVLINGDATTEKEFREAWDVLDDEGNPTLSYLVIPVKWGSLANNASATNEILQLLDADGEVVCEANYESGGDWPSIRSPGGPSIYLTDITVEDLNDGTLWRASVVGRDGARNNRKTTIFNGTDIGSPGFVPGLSSPRIATDDPTPRPATGDNVIDY